MNAEAIAIRLLCPGFETSAEQTSALDRNSGCLQCGEDGCSLPQLVQEPIDHRGISIALHHGTVIQIKVAGESAASVVVAFFGENDLVDEPATPQIDRRQPRNLDIAEPALQALQQRMKSQTA